MPDRGDDHFLRDADPLRLAHDGGDRIRQRIGAWLTWG